MAGSDKLYLQPILKDLLDGLNTSMSSIDGIVDGLGDAVAAMKLAVDGVSETLTTVKGSLDTTNTNLITVNDSIVAPNKYLMPSEADQDNIGVHFGTNGTKTGTALYPYTEVGRFRANFDGAVNIIVNAKKSSGGLCDLVLCDLSSNNEFMILEQGDLSINAATYTIPVPVEKGHAYAVAVKGTTGDIILAAETISGLGETPLAAFYAIDYTELAVTDYVLAL